MLLHAWLVSAVLRVPASKETDVLFGLLSYARKYWRKSLDRKTATEAAMHVEQKLTLMLCPCLLHDAIRSACRQLFHCKLS